MNIMMQNEQTVVNTDENTATGKEIPKNRENKQKNELQCLMEFFPESTIRKVDFTRN